MVGFTKKIGIEPTNTKTIFSDSSCKKNKEGSNASKKDNHSKRDFGCISWMRSHGKNMMPEEENKSSSIIISKFTGSTGRNTRISSKEEGKSKSSKQMKRKMA